MSLNSLLKKRVLLGLSILIVLGLIFPQISYALPQWAEGIANSLFNALIGGIFSILLTVTEFFLKFASMVLGWVTSPDFVSVSYTGMDNPMIKEGWTRIRNLANMFFIIGLVVIGIATALRIGEYQAKKALPKLIIIALLVNFTPVICGVVIDGANIVMNFFLQDVTVGGIVDDLAPKIQDIFGEGDIAQQNPITTMGKGMGWVAFNVIATIVFLLFAIIFAFRYIALWILVIISPFAFACYIFPYTKKWFDQWVNQFVQWCIIGIPAAFTLWLGEMLIQNTKGGDFISEPGASESALAAFTQPLMWYAVPILFMIGGFLISLKTSATGADTVIHTSQTAAKFASSKGWASTKHIAQERASQWAESEEQATEEDREDMGRLRKFASQMGKPIYATRRAVGRQIQERAGTAEENIDDREKEMEDKTLPQMQHIASSSLSALPARIAALTKAIDKGIHEKLDVDEDTKKMLGKELLKKAPGKFSKFKNAFPDLTEQIASDIDKEFSKDKDRANLIKQKGGLTFKDEKERNKYDGSIMQKIIAEMSPKDLENVDIDRLNNEENQEEVQEAIHRFWTGRQLGKAAQEFGHEFVDVFNKNLKEARFYRDQNSELARYIRGNAAQDAGYETIVFPEERGTGGTSSENTPGRGPIPEEEEEEGPKIETPPGKGTVKGTYKKGWTPTERKEVEEKRKRKWEEAMEAEEEEE